MVGAILVLRDGLVACAMTPPIRSSVIVRWNASFNEDAGPDAVLPADDTSAVQRRAIERWENEGGGLPVTGDLEIAIGLLHDLRQMAQQGADVLPREIVRGRMPEDSVVGALVSTGECG